MLVLEEYFQQQRFKLNKIANKNDTKISTAVDCCDFQ